MDTKEFTDLHIHTIFSYDGRNAMEDYVVAAIARGDKRIGFSEHYDYDCVLCGTGQNTPPCNVEEYKNELLRLTEKYGESIEILFGAEFGYDKRATERYGELVEKYRFDYVINSVHLYNGTDYYILKNSLKPDAADYVYRSYLETVRESLSANYPWQIAGHIGYPKRYFPFNDSGVRFLDYGAEHAEVAKALVDSGKFLELNASTKGAGEFLPEKDLVNKYLSAGGKNFTFGSDAHSLERYKDGESAVIKFLAGHGASTAYFKNQKPVTVNL